MGIDAKCNQVCVYKSLHKFVISLLRFVENHPCVSGILSLVFFLYTYYPCIFKVLIYSSPIIACTIVYIGISCPKILILDSVKKTESSHVQSCIRRNADDNKKNEFSSFNVCNAEKAQTCDDEPSSSDSKLCNGSKEWSRNGFGSVADLESLNMEEDEDDEEDAQEDINKAVEWSEDDQKNFMDLGTSDIERNKRLESLIAKRRARKTLSMHVQRNSTNLIDFEPFVKPLHPGPILIARNNNPLNQFSSSSHEPMPGSAPSVLVPMANPFDLPYDPQEEKPNLTGDVFQQDILTAQPDLCFCRHESFSLGPSFPVEAKLHPVFGSGSDKRALKDSLYSRFTQQSDEKLDEQLESLESGTLTQRDNDHVEPEVHLSQQAVTAEEHDDLDVKADDKKVEVSNGSLSSSSSLSESNESINAKKHEIQECSESRAGDFPWALNNALQKSIARTNPNPITMDLENMGQTNDPFYDSSSSASDVYYEERKPGHTPSFSMASDMQVEVSETGSPQLTIGTASPTDGESVTYEEDVEKEIASCNDEMWGVVLSGLNQKSEHSENAVEEVTLGSSLFSSPVTEFPEEGEVKKAHSGVHDVVTEELEKQMFSSPPDEELHDISTLQEPYNSPEISSGNENLSKTFSDLVLTLNKDADNLQFIEDIACQGEPSVMHQNDNEISIAAGEKVELEPQKNESNMDFTPPPDSEGAQCTTEIGISRMNSNESVITSVGPENIGVEQIVFDSSTSSSPKSVLPENAFNDQTIQIDVQHSENLDMDIPQIEQHLMENQMDFISNIQHDLENMQEHTISERSSEEGNIFSNEDQLVAHEMEGNGESHNITMHSPIMEVPQPAEEGHTSIAVAIQEKSAIDVHGTVGIKEETIEDSTKKLANASNCGSYDKGEYERLTREEVITEPKNDTEINEKITTEDTAGKSKSHIGEEMMPIPSSPMEETRNEHAVYDDNDSNLLIDDLLMEVTEDMQVNQTV